MPRWQIAYVAGCLAVVGGSLGYLLCDFGSWPLLMYEPYERSWVLANKPPANSSMVYPGMLLWGFTAALSAAALTILIASRFPRPVSEAVLQLVGGWAITAVLVTALYFLWGLWPF